MRAQKQPDKHYWVTPPELMSRLKAEFDFDFDPCPEMEQGLQPYDGLGGEWGKSNYVNPPFRRVDSSIHNGPTAWLRKAFDESKKGKLTVLVVPTQSYVNLALRGGQN